MKTHLPEIFRSAKVLLFSVVLLLGAELSAQSPCKDIPALLELLEEVHVDPRSIDDDFSEDVYAASLKRLDPYGLVLLQEDIAALEKHKTSIDNQILDGDCRFFAEAAERFEIRLKALRILVPTLTEANFDFEAGGKFVLSDPGETLYPADSVAQGKLWTDWVKVSLMDDFIDETPDSACDLTHLEARLPELRTALKKRVDLRFNRKLQPEAGFGRAMDHLWLDVIAACFDPHSRYFSPDDREDFLASVSAEELSFGIRFAEGEEGSLVISHLVPGGPAWTTNELSNGDVVLSYQFPGKDPVKLLYADPYEIEYMLESSGPKEVDLKVRKRHGTVQEVHLVKGKIRADENVIKTFLLKGTHPVGYLSLPGFYTEWENDGKLGCANDVARQLLTLNREGIKGLILDLRDNGGGSMKEAIELAGIFVDAGPIVVQEDRVEGAYTIKDPNRGTIYNGPLIVMVNGSSASASEVLAGTLQDYNRAVIVGSPSYGKATGQVILPLDPVQKNALLRNFDDVELGKGFVKVTTDRLYRVTGRSHQFSGVIPNIQLPGYPGEALSRESLRANALPPSTIDKKVYWRPLTPGDTASLFGKIRSRIRAEGRFSKIKNSGEQLLNELDQDHLPLRFSDFLDMERREGAFWKVWEESISFPQDNFYSANTQADTEILTMDTWREEINERLLDDLQNDVYLGEAYRIMCNLIESQ